MGGFTECGTTLDTKNGHVEKLDGREGTLDVKFARKSVDLISGPSDMDAKVR